jgi:hypothetical protein
MTKLSDTQARDPQRRCAARGPQRPATSRLAPRRRRHQGGRRAAEARADRRDDDRQPDQGGRRAQPHLAQRRGRPRRPPAHHDAGLAAIGVEPEGSDSAPTGADAAPSAEDPQDAPAEADPAPKARTPRAGTKQETLIAMLRAEGGATIDEMAAATGWAAHSIRGVLSGTLKKKLGLAVTSEKVAGRARRYRLPAV